MQIHGSCAARDGAAVVILGPSGSGKSDLLFRLLDRGFDLVADDRIDLREGVASPPPALAGLLELRGLGVIRVSHVASARVALAVQLTVPVTVPERLPWPAVWDAAGVPLIRLDARPASAAQLVEWALDCALGKRSLVEGAIL